MALLVQAVIAGLGVAVVQRCLVEDDLTAGRIAIALDRPVQSSRGYHLCHAASKSDFGRWPASGSGSWSRAGARRPRHDRPYFFQPRSSTHWQRAAPSTNPA